MPLFSRMYRNSLGPAVQAVERPGAQPSSGPIQPFQFQMPGLNAPIDNSPFWNQSGTPEPSPQFPFISQTPPPDEDQPTRIPGQPSLDNIDPEAAAIRRGLQDVSAISGLIQAAEEAGQELSPEAADALIRAKEYAAELTGQLDAQIQQRLRQVQLYDALLQNRLNPDKPVILGELMDLAEAEDLQPGGGQEWFEQVVENAGNNEALEALIHNQNDKTTAINEIENFVFTKNQLKDNLATYEEDLRAQDLAEQIPSIPLGIIADYEQLGNFEMLKAFDDVTADIDDQTAQQLIEQVLSINEEALPEGQTVDEVLNAMASQHGLDPAEFINAYHTGQDRRETIVNELEASEGSVKIKPYSTTAAHNIFQAALPKVGEEEATMLANSPIMHRLLDMSGGSAHFEAGGDIKGIGALSERVYNDLGTPFETIKDDVQAQIGALIDYILVGWDGDLRAAYTEMVQRGEWGTIQMLARQGEAPLEFSFGQ